MDISRFNVINIDIYELEELIKRNVLDEMGLKYKVGENSFEILLPFKAMDWIEGSYRADKVIIDLKPKDSHEIEVNIWGTLSFSQKHVHIPNEEANVTIDKFSEKLYKTLKGNLLIPKVSQSKKLLSYLLLLITSIGYILLILAECYAKVIIPNINMDMQAIINVTIVIVFCLPIYLFLFSDLRKRYFLQYSNKNIWRLTILFLPLIGALLYYLKILLPNKFPVE